jgi:transcription termination/antitermination protein NusG
MSNLWYALQVKSRSEQIAHTHLCARGFVALLPQYKSRRRWSDRYQEITLPLFPGYVFCQIDILNRRPVITTPGVVSIVGAGSLPVAIEEAEMAAIQTVVNSGIASEPWRYLQVGQNVRVTDGPLCGLEGILVDLGRHSHLVLSIELLQRSIAVQVQRDAVMPIPAKARVASANLHDGFAHREARSREVASSTR